MLAGVTSLLLACSGTPDDVPVTQGFSFPELSGVTLTDVCTSSDRVQASRCLIDAYLPVLNEIFEPVVTSRGQGFTAPTVLLDDTGVQTACGILTMPAYCPADETIVVPLNTVSNLGDRAPDAALERVLFNPAVQEYFTRELSARELTEGGSYASVIAVVHEYAHHVQNLIGSLAIYQERGHDDPIVTSRRIELEADCLTGWVSGYLAKLGLYEPTVLDSWASATTLAEIGDDFLDPTIGAGGHGSIEQRVAAWQEGIISGIQPSEPYAACMSITDNVLAGTTGGQANGLERR